MVEVLRFRTWPAGTPSPSITFTTTTHSSSSSSASSSPPPANSMYVGDAAGRSIATLAGRSKDFACTDRKFAHNVGVAFKTPEEVFAGHAPAPFDWGGVSPADLDALLRPRSPTAPPADALGGLLPMSRGSLDVVLFVGCPGSGKSEIFRRHFSPAGYVHVNRDTLKTMDACLASMRSALADGANVVVDNTSPTAADRKPFIEAARAAGASVRCLRVATPRALAEHLNRARAVLAKQTRVPTMVYNMYFAKFQAPDAASEGLDAVATAGPLRIDASQLSPVELRALRCLHA